MAAKFEAAHFSKAVNASKKLFHVWRQKIKAQDTRRLI